MELATICLEADTLLFKDVQIIYEKKHNLYFSDL
jgi:hypothetical protein